MKKCPSCGEINQDSCAFCSICGKRLTDVMQGSLIPLSRFSNSEEIFNRIKFLYAEKFKQAQNAHSRINDSFQNLSERYKGFDLTQSQKDLLQSYEDLETSANDLAESNQLVTAIFFVICKVSLEDVSIDEYQKAASKFIQNEGLAIKRLDSESQQLFIKAISKLGLAIDLFIDD